jgi:hypothetical protein
MNRCSASNDSLQGITRKSSERITATEVSKAQFATAFGDTVQPLKGDLVYIPMMKRMWMVNSAYEEKKEGFMWNNTVLQVALVKYEEKDAVDTSLGDDIINAVVKNKYENLFDDDDKGTNVETFSAPVYAANSSYAVYESDALRKYIAIDKVTIEENYIYHKGMVLQNQWYNISTDGFVTYQNKYCGTDGTIAFFIQNTGTGIGTVLQIGDKKVEKNKNIISWLGCNLRIERGLYLIYFRWSMSLKCIEGNAIQITLPEDIPAAKVNPGSYYLDFNNKISKVFKYTSEIPISEKSEIILNCCGEKISGIKIFSEYEENISDIMQQYPNNNKLIVNDTVKSILDKPGYAIK